MNTTTSQTSRKRSKSKETVSEVNQASGPTEDGQRQRVLPPTSMVNPSLVIDTPTSFIKQGAPLSFQQQDKNDSMGCTSLFVMRNSFPFPSSIDSNSMLILGHLRGGNGGVQDEVSNGSAISGDCILAPNVTAYPGGSNNITATPTQHQEQQEEFQSPPRQKPLAHRSISFTAQQNGGSASNTPPQNPFLRPLIIPSSNIAKDTNGMTMTPPRSSVANKENILPLNPTTTAITIPAQGSTFSNEGFQLQHQTNLFRSPSRTTATASFKGTSATQVICKPESSPASSCQTAFANLNLQGGGGSLQKTPAAAPANHQMTDSAHYSKGNSILQTTSTTSGGGQANSAATPSNDQFLKDTSPLSSASAAAPGEDKAPSSSALLGHWISPSNTYRSIGTHGGTAAGPITLRIPPLQPQSLGKPSLDSPARCIVSSLNAKLESHATDPDILPSAIMQQQHQQKQNYRNDSSLLSPAPARLQVGVDTSVTSHLPDQTAKHTNVAIGTSVGGAAEISPPDNQSFKIKDHQVSARRLFQSPPPSQVGVSTVKGINQLSAVSSGSNHSSNNNNSGGSGNSSGNKRLLLLQLSNSYKHRHQASKGTLAGSEVTTKLFHQNKHLEDIAEEQLLGGSFGGGVQSHHNNHHQHILNSSSINNQSFNHNPLETMSIDNHAGVSDIHSFNIDGPNSGSSGRKTRPHFLLADLDGLNHRNIIDDFNSQSLLGGKLGGGAGEDVDNLMVVKDEHDHYHNYSSAGISLFNNQPQHNNHHILYDHQYHNQQAFNHQNSPPQFQSSFGGGVGYHHQQQLQHNGQHHYEFPSRGLFNLHHHHHHPHHQHLGSSHHRGISKSASLRSHSFQQGYQTSTATGGSYLFNSSTTSANPPQQHYNYNYHPTFTHSNTGGGVIGPAGEAPTSGGSGLFGDLLPGHHHPMCTCGASQIASVAKQQSYNSTTSSAQPAGPAEDLNSAAAPGGQTIVLGGLPQQQQLVRHHSRKHHPHITRGGGAAPGGVGHHPPHRNFSTKRGVGAGGHRLKHHQTSNVIHQFTAGLTNSNFINSHIEVNVCCNIPSPKDSGLIRNNNKGTEAKSREAQNGQTSTGAGMTNQEGNYNIQITKTVSKSAKHNNSHQETAASVAATGNGDSQGQQTVVSKKHHHHNTSSKKVDSSLKKRLFTSGAVSGGVLNATPSTNYGSGLQNSISKSNQKSNAKRQLQEQKQFETSQHGSQPVGETGAGDNKFQTPKGPNLFHHHSNSGHLAGTSGTASQLMILSTPDMGSSNKVGNGGINLESTTKKVNGSNSGSSNSQANHHQHLLMLQSSDQKSGSNVPSSNNGSRPVCNCKKSKCLKLYCDCFALGLGCGPDCKCCDCSNEEGNEERKVAMAFIMERNPHAFKPKIQDRGFHAKGCHCKKSGCLKKYCECYQSGVACTDRCTCDGCKNCQDRLNKDFHGAENDLCTDDNAMIHDQEEEEDREFEEEFKDGKVAQGPTAGDLDLEMMSIDQDALLEPNAVAGGAPVESAGRQGDDDQEMAAGQSQSQSSLSQRKFRSSRLASKQNQQQLQKNAEEKFRSPFADKDQLVKGEDQEHNSPVRLQAASANKRRATDQLVVGGLLNTTPSSKQKKSNQNLTAQKGQNKRVPEIQQESQGSSSSKKAPSQKPSQLSSSKRSPNKLEEQQSESSQKAATQSANCITTRSKRKQMEAERAAGTGGGGQQSSQQHRL